MFIIQIITDNQYIYYLTDFGVSTNKTKSRKFNSFIKAEEEALEREKKGEVVNIIILRERYKEEVSF